MTDARLEWHLWNWEQWQYRQRQDYGRRYPSRADAGIWRSSSSDLDAMISAADVRCAKAVEAILDGISPVLRCAIHAVHLDAVYRFPRVDVGEAYDRATEAVRKGLVARGIP